MQKAEKSMVPVYGVRFSGTMLAIAASILIIDTVVVGWLVYHHTNYCSPLRQVSLRKHQLFDVRNKTTERHTSQYFLPHLTVTSQLRDLMFAAFYYLNHKHTCQPVRLKILEILQVF